MSERPPKLLDRLSRTTSFPGVASLLRHGYLFVRRFLGRLGFQLIVSTYDSPIPDVNALDSRIFDQPSALRGIDLNLDGQLAFLERELAEFCREYEPPLTAAQAGPHRFYLQNGTYESVDAELLYAVVRHFRPMRILELGSGYSTLIIREALVRGHGGAPDDVLRTYDPYRSGLLPPEARVVPLRAQDVPEEAFRELAADDVLFVDTSHTVKVGGDVNRIVLDVLPILRPGVIVHFHDIFLPYSYSRAHLEAAHFWTEQYLLQAFLTENQSWEVLLAAHGLARAAPARLAASIPSFGAGVNPGAFWIRRRG